MRLVVLLILLHLTLLFTYCKSNKNICQSEPMDNISLPSEKYGTYTIEGTIIKIAFTDKAGRTHSDVYDLYLKTKENQYFIKQLGGKYTHSQLLEYIDKTTTFIVNIQFGLWDAYDNTVESRVGDYCEIIDIQIE